MPMTTPERFLSGTETGHAQTNLTRFTLLSFSHTVGTQAAHLPRIIQTRKLSLASKRQDRTLLVEVFRVVVCAAAEIAMEGRRELQGNEQVRNQTFFQPLRVRMMISKVVPVTT